MSEQNSETLPLESLLLRARLGEADARARLLRRLQDPIHRFCWSQLADAESARDATQETALRILSGLDTFRGSSRVKTWALGIALNVCREIRRQIPRYGSGGNLDNATGPSNAPHALLERQEREEQLQTLLECLTERQREMIVLRYFEDLSIKETAQVMKVATGTVKATIWQALRSMRNMVEHGNDKATTNG